MKPFVSIIIPVYNVETYVEACILSVMSQTYTGSMECMIVDDCCTDNSITRVAKLISEYKGPISFRILSHDLNRGLSAARNTGMDAANGDYIFFIDSDDEITSDCIERLSMPLETEWYDVIMGDLDRMDVSSPDHPRIEESSYKLKIPNNTLLTKPEILRMYGSHWRTMAWNKLYKKSFITKYHLSFKEGLLHEDNLWGFQIACVASSFFVINKVTYFWKSRKESISSRANRMEERADALRVSIKEMSRFVKYYHIDDAECFPYFSDFFYFVLHYHPASRSAFVSTYKELRPFFRVPIRGLFRVNRFNLKHYLRDLHYYLPLSFAPLWCYFILYRHRSTQNTKIKR